MHSGNEGLSSFLLAFFHYYTAVFALAGLLYSATSASTLTFISPTKYKVSFMSNLLRRVQIIICDIIVQMMLLTKLNPVH